MKIILVGATGTLGAPLHKALAARHEVVPVSATKSDVKVDMADPDSIKALFETVGPFDALVVTAGHSHYGPLREMTEADVYKGIRGKLMGQVNLVLIGQHYIRDGGSFTLTSGILSVDPIRGGTVSSLVNNGIHGFVLGAAVDLIERGVRINAVSAALVEESVPKLGRFFPGHTPVAMHKVVDAYVKSVEGGMTGKVLEVYG